MLKINELITSSESFVIKKKNRSSFYESTSLSVERREIRLSYDKMRLVSFISGESEGFKNKAKNLFNRTVKFIRDLAKKIWEIIKKAGRWLKYLFTGKIGEFKDDERWRETEKEIKEALDSSIDIWEKFNKSKSEGIYEGEPIAEDFIKRMKEIRAAYDSDISVKEKLKLVDEENELRLKHHQTIYDIMGQTEEFSKAVDKSNNIMETVEELAKTTAADSKNNTKSTLSAKKYVESSVASEKQGVFSDDYKKRSRAKSGSAKYRELRKRVDNAFDKHMKHVEEAKDAVEEVTKTNEEAQNDLKSLFGSNFKKKNR